MSKSAWKNSKSQATDLRYLSGPERKPQRLTKEYLIGFHIGALAWGGRLGSICLSIYRLVIFPGMLGYIEMAVVDTFEQIQHDSNPSPAILVETFRSLNYCRHNHERRFLGCAPLLYLWIRSNISCEGITSTKSYFLGAAPIAEFCQNTWPQSETEEWWVLSLRDPSRLQWMTSIVPMWEPILCTPFEPWGMISYAPLLALRQFGAKKFIPATARLALLEITYVKSEKAKMLSQVIQAWKDPHRARLA